MTTIKWLIKWCVIMIIMDGNPCKNGGCRITKSENCMNKTRFFVSSTCSCSCIIFPGFDMSMSGRSPSANRTKAVCRRNGQAVSCIRIQRYCYLHGHLSEITFKNHGNLNYMRKCGS